MASRERAPHHRIASRRPRGEANQIKRQGSRNLGEIVRASVPTRSNALLGSLCAVVFVVSLWQAALVGGVLIMNFLIGIVQGRRERQLDRLALPPRTVGTFWPDFDKAALEAANDKARQIAACGCARACRRAIAAVTAVVLGGGNPPRGNY